MSSNATQSELVVGADGSAASYGAVTWATHEAKIRGLSLKPLHVVAPTLISSPHRRVPLIALHAWSDVGIFPILGMDWRIHRDEGDEVLGERLAGWHASYPEVQVHRKLVCDVPARWLIDESENAQLVVGGSRGRGGLDGLHLGSVSSAVRAVGTRPGHTGPWR